MALKEVLYSSKDPATSLLEQTYVAGLSPAKSKLFFAMIWCVVASAPALVDSRVQATFTSFACHKYTSQFCFRDTAQLDANSVVQVCRMKCLWDTKIKSVRTMNGPVEILLMGWDGSNKVGILGVLDDCCFGRTISRLRLYSANQTPRTNCVCPEKLV